MKPSGHYDFETLQSEIYIVIGDYFVAYLFQIAPDRTYAHMTRQTFNAAGDQIIEQLEADFTQDELENNATFPPVVHWWAKGLWGLPLEFQGIPRAGEADKNPVAVIPGEIPTLSDEEPEAEPEAEPEDIREKKPAPRPRPKLAPTKKKR